MASSCGGPEREDHVTDSQQHHPAAIFTINSNSSSSSDNNSGRAEQVQADISSTREKVSCTVLEFYFFKPSSAIPQADSQPYTLYIAVIKVDRT